MTEAPEVLAHNVSRAFGEAGPDRGCVLRVATLPGRSGAVIGRLPARTFAGPSG